MGVRGEHVMSKENNAALLPAVQTLQVWGEGLGATPVHPEPGTWQQTRIKVKGWGNPRVMHLDSS